MTPFLLTLVASFTAPDISSFTQPKLKDASFTATVKSSNHKELTKIGADFANSYHFKSTKVFLKEPFKLRLEALVEDQSVDFILNGTTRWYRIPSAKLNTKEDLSKSPGKRQTWLDFGILTPGMFGDLFEAAFVRKDVDTGALVYDLTYEKNLDDTSRHRVFIDPVKKYILKREWYGQDGTLRAVFLYESPVQGNGVWFPTKLTVKNAEGKVGGTSGYSDVKLNSGLSDSLFSVR